MPTIHCLQHVITSGGSHYPIYIGFLPAAEILQLAEAPSFSLGTLHQEIAQNIVTPPIKDWQRPLDTDRVQRISTVFDNTGQLMPNPVLLCENVTTNRNLINVQQHTAGGIPTMVWEVDLPVPGHGEPKLLWILDGQHRINGLARSLQASNPLPVVLLLNTGRNAYSGPLLAKLFAQVTTSAQQLDDLHNEWLTFAFGLDEYDAGVADSAEHTQAMRAVAELCKMPLLDAAGTANPFSNQVKFNVHRGVSPQPGGFAYTCKELKDLLRRYYYASSPTTGMHLPPLELARNIGLAYVALTQVVTAPQSHSVFFGAAEHGQRIMQDAFLVGVMTFLLNHGAPISWVTVLDNLSFRTTNWNFRSWVRSLSGPAQTTSRKLAFDVFAKVFRDRALPAGAHNLGDFLRGNNARVMLEFSNLSAANRPVRANRQQLELTRGAALSASIDTRRHIRVIQISENIGKLIITDKKSPPGRVVAYPQLIRPGLILDPGQHSNPLSLLFTMQHYGGVEAAADVDIQWI